MATFDKDKLKKIPTAGLFSFIKLYRLFHTNPLEGFQRLTEKYGEFFKVELLGQEMFIVNNPEYIQYILKDNYVNYQRAHSLELFAELMGKGLFSAEHELWVKMKKTLSPAFHQKQIESNFSTILEESLDYISKNIEPSNDDVIINMELEIKRLTLKISAKLFLSPQLEINTDPIIDALNDIFESADVPSHIRHKVKMAVSRRLPISIRKKKHVAEALEYLNGLAQQIVEEFFNERSEKSFFLQLLFDAYKANEIDVDQAIDEIKTLFFAGFETIAAGITWTLYSIDKEPGLRKQLEAEIDRVMPDGILTVEKLNEFKLLYQTIKESLRLYPPAWSFHRIAMNEDVIDGYYIPKNAWIMISPYTMHRNEKYWKNPKKFDITRFENEENSIPVRYDYIPFSQGPRISIGSRLALFEMSIIIPLIIQKYRVQFRTKKPPVFLSTAVIHSKNLILNHITRRKK